MARKEPASDAVRLAEIAAEEAREQRNHNFRMTALLGFLVLLAAVLFWTGKDHPEQFNQVVTHILAFLGGGGTVYGGQAIQKRNRK